MEKTLRYALVGCGSFGSVHLDVLTRLAGTEITALCDIHPESCERLKERFGLDVPCYTDYREMLAAEKDNIDIVDVVTSDKAHCPVTLAALEAGCHVMCEKPMSLFTEECTAMVKKAEEKGIIASVITDAGMTEFHGVPTKTCLALEPLPDDIADELTGGLPLY